LVYFGYSMFQPFIPIWFMGNEFNVRDLTESYDPMHSRIYYNRLTWADYDTNQDHLNAVRKMIYIRKKYKNLIGPSTHRLKDKPMVKVPVVGTQPDLPGYGYYNPSGDPVGIIVLGTKTNAVGGIRVKLPLAEMRLDGYVQYNFHNLMSDTITTLAPENGDEFVLEDLSAWDSLIYKIEPNWTFTLLDNFDSGGVATGDLNHNLAVRQAGSSAQYGYTLPHYAHQLTAIGELAMNDGEAVDLDANLMPYLASNFTVKVDGKVTTDWISFSVIGDVDNARHLSPMSFLVRAFGNDDVLWVNHGVGGSGWSMSVSQGTMDAALGSFNPHDWHTYEFRVAASSATSGTFGFYVDGVAIAPSLTYQFNDSTDRTLRWVNPPGGNGLWDNLELTLDVYPEYEGWAVDEGLAAGMNDARADDPDLDGMNNLVEYALGGNPLVDDAAVYAPVFNISGDWVTYVYNRRHDYAIRGLTYGLKVSVDLSGTWTDSGTAYETASVAIDSEFDSVTNKIDITGIPQGFLQLEITEN
ncbi:MAG: hypothetical protein DRP64_00555, partial [Verrucomicrobia bacterium]